MIMTRELSISTIDDWYSWDAHSVDFMDKLVEDINSGDWYKILKRHIKPGNSKLAKNTWVFNISSAHDCPHLGTERCQVTKGDSTKCYAFHNELQYPAPLPFRRRQEVIWDILDAQTLAETLIAIKANKTADVEIQALRVNESGDLRHEGDLHKLNEVARILREEENIRTYVYSASSNLDWSVLDERYFTVNGSNPWMEGIADQLFVAKDRSEIAEDDVVCPAELHGREEIKCGECRICWEPHGRTTVVPVH